MPPKKEKKKKIIMLEVLTRFSKVAGYKTNIKCLLLFRASGQ